MDAVPPAPDPPLRLDIEESGKETILRCTGKIASDTCSVFQETVRRLISQGKSIVVDLSKVSSIDSAGLGALVASWSSAKRRSVEVDIRWAKSRSSPPAPDLKIVNPSDRVAKLLRLTRLDRLLGNPEVPE